MSPFKQQLKGTKMGLGSCFGTCNNACHSLCCLSSSLAYVQDCDGIDHLNLLSNLFHEHRLSACIHQHVSDLLA